MLTHLVMFKLKAEHQNQADYCRNLLLTLPGQIETIRHYEIGINILPSARAYDFALYSRFDSLAAMESYQVHPAHVAVGQQIVPLCDSIISVDYED
jgi:hypothetical protein